MSESNAKAVAAALGGTTWHMGGNIWVVKFAKDAGFVVLSEEGAAEYADDQAWTNGNAKVMVDFL